MPSNERAVDIYHFRNTNWFRLPAIHIGGKETERILY